MSNDNNMGIITRSLPLSADECAYVARQYSTPSYVYDEARLLEASSTLTSFTAPYGFTPRYAVKANATTRILRFFDGIGFSFDASTIWEAARVVRVGIAPEKVQLTAQILHHGFEDILRSGIRIVGCSLRQIELVGQTAPGAEIGIRINPGRGTGESRRRNVAGPDASFGVWYECLAEARQVAEQHGLQIVLAHHHVGSGGRPETWIDLAATMLRLLDVLPEVRSVNFGGGFRVARMPSEVGADVPSVLRELVELIESFARETGRRLAVELEPGNYLTANAGVIVATVMDVVKTGRDGHTFVKLDAGMAELLRPTLYGSEHPIAFARNGEFLDDNASEAVVVVGPCCESGDLLTPRPGDPEILGPRLLPVPNVGDIAIIGGAGAYSAAMCAKNYNSIPAAPEVFRRSDGRFELIRRRQALEDVVAQELE